MTLSKSNTKYLTLGFYMDPRKHTSKVARQLYLKIATNRVEIDLHKNDILKLQRERHKLHMLCICPEYSTLLQELKQYHTS